MTSNEFWFYLESIFAAPLRLVTCEQILSNYILILPLVGGNFVQFFTCFKSNVSGFGLLEQTKRQTINMYYIDYLLSVYCVSYDKLWTTFSLLQTILATHRQKIDYSCVSNQMLSEIGFCILCIWGQLINYACVGNWSK